MITLAKRKKQLDSRFKPLDFYLENPKKKKKTSRDDVIKEIKEEKPQEPKKTSRKISFTERIGQIEFSCDDVMIGLGVERLDSWEIALVRQGEISVLCFNTDAGFKPFKVHTKQIAINVLKELVIAYLDDQIDMETKISALFEIYAIT